MDEPAGRCSWLIWTVGRWRSTVVELGVFRKWSALSDPVQDVGGDVSQVFRTDAEWAEALAAVRGALRSGGLFLFETRGPARQAWLGWTRERRSARRDILASDRSRCGATS